MKYSFLCKVFRYLNVLSLRIIVDEISFVDCWKMDSDKKEKSKLKQQECKKRKKDKDDYLPEANEAAKYQQRKLKSRKKNKRAEARKVSKKEKRKRKVRSIDNLTNELYHCSHLYLFFDLSIEKAIHTCLK